MRLGSILPRPLLRQTLISRTLNRPSSTLSPIVNITDHPAPHTGFIRILTLNNPTTRNAISRALLSSLSTKIASIHAEGPQGPTRALIITSGVGGVFCAGADLKERKGFTSEETAAFLTSLRQTLTMLSSLSIPTISAIGGAALGGGLELALSTHLRILSSTATVGLPETRLAIIPGAGGTYRLPALIGRGKALDMLLTGRRLGGREAYAWGIGERFVDLTEETEGARGEIAERSGKMVREEAVKWAEEICEGGPGAIRAVLRAFGKGQEAENREYDGVVGMEDRDEALRAFAEKRKPRFIGV